MTTFLHLQGRASIEKYAKNLKICGALSRLFSTSDTPYLQYRISEQIFCKSFGAVDLSRSDIAVDASKEDLGLGIKTFGAKPKNHSFEKIAEFNADRNSYNDLTAEGKIRKISELRNQRIKFAKNGHNLEACHYHCVVRREGYFDLCEEKMPFINLDKLTKIKNNGPSIRFEDDRHEYNFNISKSTLFKRFWTDKPVKRIPIEIMPDPMSLLDSILEEKASSYGTKQKQFPIDDTTFTEQVEFVLQPEEEHCPTAYLPLYGKNKIVQEKAGLNQWNAEGRQRDPNEVYIPVPAKFHDRCPGFFPPKDTKFELILPGQKTISAKICQDGCKALMSDPNKELGKWILRDVLRLKDCELLTIDRLYQIGIDSVRIDKLKDGVYEMNFAAVDSYEDFINE